MKTVLALIAAVLIVGIISSQLTKSAGHPVADRQALFVEYRGFHQLIARGLLAADCAQRKAVARDGLAASNPRAKAVCLDEEFAASMGMFQDSDTITGNGNG